MIVTALAPVALFAQPASAFPPGDALYTFKYKVVATTFIKKADLTLTTPPGVFQGAIDLNTGQLKGSIALPNVTFTQSEAGVGLVTATSATVSTKPVTGHVNLANFKVTTTSTFNIHIVTMYPDTPSVPLPVPVPKVNLVGDSRTTVAPISVTMSGKASLGSSSTFTGSFTIPDFQNCQAMTTVINQEIPGPGNTFSATASPS
ncbi:MAG: hypothetical protein ACLPVY_22315 [Acidimicrobiia bacterium]